MGQDFLDTQYYCESNEIILATYYMIVVKHLVPFFCHCPTDKRAFVCTESSTRNNILNFLTRVIQLCPICSVCSVYLSCKVGVAVYNGGVS